ncbi:type IV pilus secretin PilQ [Candidatus Omnitrophota bacterium]
MSRMVICAVIACCGCLLLSPGAGLAADELTKPADLAVQEEKPALITMDFEDAEIRDVVRVIAMASGMNMVIGEDVQAKVTIALQDVHWEKALDIILRTYNFSYKKEENLIRIMTFEKIKQEQRDIPLVTEIVYLNFSDVTEFKGTLSEMLSDRGTIETDKRTNSMIISDIPAKVEELVKIARQLDTRTPQVLIEAMLVDVKLTKYDDLGINWKILNVDRPEDQYSSRVYNENYMEAPAAAMNPVASPTIDVGFLKRFGAYGIDGLISAWIQDDQAEILASPKIITLDNQTAKIEIKDQVAYSQSTQNDSGGTTVSTQFKDVVTGLEVTPHITMEGFVGMHLKPKQEYVDGTVGGEPKIASRSAETHVLVEDGETIIIGGMRKIEDRETVTRIPFLSDLPWVGKFFRSSDKEKTNTEFLMFVTPHIIVHPELTDEELSKLTLLDKTREEFFSDGKKRRLKAAQQQASLSESEFSEQELMLEEEIILESEDVQLNQQPAPEQEEEYIYSW